MKRRMKSSHSCLLAINKPAGMTSHDVVGRLRKILHESRIGHAGTLDPDATGVLIVGVGQATKLLGRLTLEEKSYMARIVFGFETSTDDAAGEKTMVAFADAQLEKLFDRSYARELLQGIKGEQEQVPPQVSAIQIAGQRAYDLARKGESIELNARSISVYKAELKEIGETVSLVDDGTYPYWDVEFEVSKGTYIRALARDLGRTTGMFAHLESLQRLSSGGVNLDACITLEELEQAQEEGTLDKLLVAKRLDPIKLLKLQAIRFLSPTEFERVSQGQRLGHTTVVDIVHRTKRMAHDEELVGLIYNKSLVGLWEAHDMQKDRLPERTLSLIDERALPAPTISCVQNLLAGVDGIDEALFALKPNLPSSVHESALVMLSEHALRFYTGKLPSLSKRFSDKTAALDPTHAKPEATVQSDAYALTSAGEAALQKEIDVCAIIGVFDGVHRGHLTLIEKAKQRAAQKGEALAIITFSPDPAALFKPDAHEALLTDEERLSALAYQMADLLIVHHFDFSFAGLAHASYIPYLQSMLSLKSLLVGENFLYGRPPQGTVVDLKKACDVADIELHVQTLLADSDDETSLSTQAQRETVSATRIRHALAEGDIKLAARLLGRFPVLQGDIVHGRGDGTHLGFPTANLQLDRSLLEPKTAVYGGFCAIDGKLWPAAMHVGIPPMYEQSAPYILEATLIGYTGDLYGKHAYAILVEFLRDSVKYESEDELIEAVYDNIAWVKASYGGGALDIK